MKCQPLALILILFSISHKAVKGKAAWSQVADRQAGVGACSARSAPYSGCLFSYLCPQVFNLDWVKKKKKKKAGGLYGQEVGPSTGGNGGGSSLVAVGSAMLRSSIPVGLREAVEGERYNSKMNEIPGQWNCSVHTNACALLISNLPQYTALQ